MKYAQIQQLAKALKNQGLIYESLSLTQKSGILLAEIKKNITKVDRKKIGWELASILLDFTILAVDNEIEATKPPQKTIKKAAKSTKEPETEEQEMTQEEFNTEFIPFYEEVKKGEELEGIVTMRFLKLQKLFTSQYSISNEKFDKYVRMFPDIFIVKENGKELVQRTY